MLRKCICRLEENQEALLSIWPYFRYIKTFLWNWDDKTYFSLVMFGHKTYFVASWGVPIMKKCLLVELWKTQNYLHLSSWAQIPSHLWPEYDHERLTWPQKVGNMLPEYCEPSLSPRRCFLPSLSNRWDRMSRKCDSWYYFNK